jgi:hypothetical protein
VAASLWAKTVTKAFEVFFVDTFQDGTSCLLDDFVFQSSDPKRSIPAVGLGNVSPLGWLRPVRSAMDSSMKIDDPLFEILRVITPRLTIDSWGCLLLEIEEAAPEKFRCDVVKQAGEL